MSRRPRKSTPRDEPPSDPPVVVNGWTILLWKEFRERWVALREEVARLRRQDPDGYRNHPATRFLRNLSEIILKQVPTEPGAARYHQGNTLGAAHRGWQRVKFNQRFRLFFRYSAAHKVIVYAWLNDERTLRQEGARTDPYAVFARMLERGRPPNGWDELVAASTSLRSSDAR